MATATITDTRTFAELHARLGGVPLERIRTKPPPGTATESDVLLLTGPTCELIDGVLVEKPMGTRESLLAIVIAGLFRQYVGATDSGVVLGSDGVLQLGEGKLRAPDVSYIPWESFPEGELPEEAYWSVVPALAVEVLSPSNTDAEMARKLKELFDAGCQLVWLIDPQTKTAKAYTSAKKHKDIAADGALDGGKVLPGFRLALADLFAATKRKKKPK